MILVAYKCKVLAECHNKLFHILHYTLFYHALVSVFITNEQFFGIDEVKQILILEHCNGTIRLQLVGDCFLEIIWQFSLMAIQIIIYDLLQILNLCFGICCKLNIKFPLFYILYFADDGIMVCETNVHKCGNREICIYLKLYSR